MGGYSAQRDLCLLRLPRRMIACHRILFIYHHLGLFKREHPRANPPRPRLGSLESSNASHWGFPHSKTRGFFYPASRRKCPRKRDSGVWTGGASEATPRRKPRSCGELSIATNWIGYLESTVMSTNWPPAGERTYSKTPFSSGLVARALLKSTTDFTG
jgi:hypothetical protein